MGKVVEIGYCYRCGKPTKKDKLQMVRELIVMGLCKECYQKYQRSQWGYW